jgi:hypothetical protein
MKTMAANNLSSGKGGLYTRMSDFMADKVLTCPVRFARNARQRHPFEEEPSLGERNRQIEVRRRQIDHLTRVYTNTGTGGTD